MPAPPARTVGLVAFVLTAGWLFVLSGLLGAVPGEPVGTRIDAYFQHDAGGRIADAATGGGGRGAIIHPLFPFVFTWPVHQLTRLLAGVVSPDLTALYACRVYVAVAVGLGVGHLTAALVRFGVPPLRLAACGPLFLLGTAQTLVALPDHFSLSVALLASSFAVFLDDRTGVGRQTGWKLGVLTLVCGGITVTNAIFPAALLAWRWVAMRGAIPRWVWPAAAVVVAGGVAFGAWVARFDPADHSNPLVWRVRGYLTGRVLDDPAGAAARAFRGITDITVGPTPATDTNNYDRRPMLTYEPTGVAYPAWPYDAVQGVAVGVWLAVLAAAVWGGIRDPHTRWPTVVLLGWAGGNVAFHVLWGDEFFLYTQHHTWAVAAVVPLGLRRVPVWVILPAVAMVAVGQVWTLIRIREVLATLAG